MLKALRSRATSALPGTALLCLLAAGAAPVWASSTHPITIAADRAMAVGSTVTVEGTATVASGTFSSSFSDEGFAIQDRGAGIYVSTAHNLHVRLNERVLVTGVLQDSSGLLILVPAADSDVHAHGRGAHVRPVWVRTGKVGTANQGELVVVVGRVTQPIEPDPPFGSKLFIDDGSGELRVFLNTSADIDPDGLTTGDLVRVVGFSSAFDTPELDPRQQSDLRSPDHPRHP